MAIGEGATRVQVKPGLDVWGLLVVLGMLSGWLLLTGGGGLHGFVESALIVAAVAGVLPVVNGVELSRRHGKLRVREVWHTTLLDETDVGGLVLFGWSGVAAAGRHIVPLIQIPGSGGLIVSVRRAPLLT